jgi:hypothetical protein
VVPFQRLREGPAGGTAKIGNKKEHDQSRYVYENKQTSDKMPEKNSDINVQPTRILQENAAIDGNLLVQFAFSRVFSCIIRAGCGVRNSPTTSESLPAPGAVIFVRYSVSRVVAESHVWIWIQDGYQ